MASPQRKLRILCLHGSRTNSTVMSLQTTGLARAFGTKAQFEHLEGPFPAFGPPEDEILDFFGKDESYFQWWNSNDHKDPELPGWEKALDHLQSHLDFSDYPYDAIIGFSQGAMVATLVTAHYMRRSKHVPYKALVLVGGMWPVDGMPHDVPVDTATSKPILDFPSIHVLGQEDEMYEVGKSQVDNFSHASRHVFTHSGGHRFPALPEYKDMYATIAQTLRDLCTESNNAGY
ncbi:Aste57867_13626 [Aphanomyces stellatus]|uniref:Aste57867_13626 protein n=1 Tax=Aphanomyces stellatus TaxID=120398 RepID=A0A485L0T4_9STRA|nr:hypothetical protein As57867_013576 [Aphanomyces stellatus]VFT90463.1 Aste57867_13626 [Aphanomyces stellatus]